SVRGMVESLIGCVAGAALMEETERFVAGAGLTEINLEPNPGYVQSMTEMNDPLYKEILAHLPEGAQAAAYITSLSVSARKPAAARCCG
ncbi:MAG: hypothetical protein KJ060_19845, partial [Candidatus Hydrogenedentes bacterium]|nr:hypothetical protein [Candidatus Hydrogenedentota bacterium]